MQYTLVKVDQLVGKHVTVGRREEDLVRVERGILKRVKGSTGMFEIIDSLISSAGGSFHFSAIKDLVPSKSNPLHNKIRDLHGRIVNIRYLTDAGEDTVATGFLALQGKTLVWVDDTKILLRQVLCVKKASEEKPSGNKNTSLDAYVGKYVKIIRELSKKSAKEEEGILMRSAESTYSIANTLYGGPKEKYFLQEELLDINVVEPNPVRNKIAECVGSTILVRHLSAEGLDRVKRGILMSSCMESKGFYLNGDFITYSGLLYVEKNEASPVGIHPDAPRFHNGSLNPDAKSPTGRHRAEPKFQNFPLNSDPNAIKLKDAFKHFGGPAEYPVDIETRQHGSDAYSELTRRRMKVLEDIIEKCAPDMQVFLAASTPAYPSSHYPWGRHPGLKKGESWEDYSAWKKSLDPLKEVNAHLTNKTPFADNFGDFITNFEMEKTMKVNTKEEFKQVVHTIEHCGANKENIKVAADVETGTIQVTLPNLDDSANPWMTDIQNIPRYDVSKASVKVKDGIITITVPVKKDAVLDLKVN